MLRLLRALLPILALASLVVGGSPAPRADHGCEGMTATAMEDCHKVVGGHDSPAVDECAAVSCGQVPAVGGPFEVFFRVPVVSVSDSIVTTSDADPASLAVSPDLRPPIA
jgi:hypothetical protein